MNTKDSILDAALELFNQQGTAAVSTNHIAQALGISPGNLYYHYRNKSEIIRALFERLFVEWDTIFSLDSKQPLALAILWELARANFRTMWAYRFIYRELAVLLRQDEWVKQRWLAVRERGFQGFRELFDRFVEAGVLADAGGPAAVDEIAELCWLISEFWLSYLEVSGREVDAGYLEQGIRLMLRAIHGADPDCNKSPGLN